MLVKWWKRDEDFSLSQRNLTSFAPTFHPHSLPNSHSVQTSSHIIIHTQHAKQCFDVKMCSDNHFTEIWGHIEARVRCHVFAEITFTVKTFGSSSNNTGWGINLSKHRKSVCFYEVHQNNSKLVRPSGSLFPVGIRMNSFEKQASGKAQQS